MAEKDAATPAVTANDAPASSADAGAEVSLVSAAASPAAAPAAADAGAAAAPAADAKPAADAAPAADAKPAADAAAAPAADAKPDPAAAKPGDTPAAPADAKPGDADPKPAEGEKKPDATKPPGEKPAAEKPGDAKPADAAADAPKAEPRTYEPFKLPDTVKLDDVRVKAFTTVLDDAALAPQDRAQKLVDLYVEEMGNFETSMRKRQQDEWKAFNSRQRDEIRNDPELGGARMDTTLGMAKSVIEQFGGTDEQVKATLAALSYTGAGNNIGLARTLHNIALAFAEGDWKPSTPPKAKDGRATEDKWYGGNGQGG